MTQKIIPAGATFFVSSGKYIDYRVHFVARALRDIDVAAEIAAHKAERTKSVQTGQTIRGFMPWLEAAGAYEEVPYFEIEFTDYPRDLAGKFDLTDSRE